MALAFVGADGGKVGGLGRERAGAEGVEVAADAVVEAVIPEQGGGVMDAPGVGQVGGGLAGQHVAELAGVGGFVEFYGGRLVGDEQGPAERAGEGLAGVGGRQVVVDHEPIVAVAGGIEDKTAIAPDPGTPGAQARPTGGVFPGVVFTEEFNGEGHGQRRET